MSMDEAYEELHRVAYNLGYAQEMRKDRGQGPLPSRDWNAEEAFEQGYQDGRAEWRRVRPGGVLVREVES